MKPIDGLLSSHAQRIAKHLPYQPTPLELRSIGRAGREEIGRNSAGIRNISWSQYKSASSPNLPRMPSAHALLVPKAGLCLLRHNNFCFQSLQLGARGERVGRKTSLLAPMGTMGINK